MRRKSTGRTKVPMTFKLFTETRTYIEDLAGKLKMAPAALVEVLVNESLMLQYLGTSEVWTKYSQDFEARAEKLTGKTLPKGVLVHGTVLNALAREQVEKEAFGQALFDPAIVIVDQNGNVTLGDDMYEILLERYRAFMKGILAKGKLVEDRIAQKAVEDRSGLEAAVTENVKELVTV